MLCLSTCSVLIEGIIFENFVYSQNYKNCRGNQAERRCCHITECEKAETSVASSWRGMGRVCECLFLWLRLFQSLFKMACECVHILNGTKAVWGCYLVEIPAIFLPLFVFFGE